MGVLLKSEDSYLIYEEQALGILVAITKSDQKLIKKYWKTKDKSTVQTQVPGYPFIQSEEQDSLKIDFTELVQYQIENLKKFD